MVWSWVKHAGFGYGQPIGDPAGDVVTVAFSRPTGIQVLPVSDLTFLPVVEVARLRKTGVLPNGKSLWNGDCAPRLLGLKESNWKHNQQTGVRGGVHLKTKFTSGGWPLGGKLRGGRQRFREDWNADNSGFAETHDRVNEGAAKYQLAEEKMTESAPRPDQRPGVPLNFRAGTRGDLTNAPEKYRPHVSEDVSDMQKREYEPVTANRNGDPEVAAIQARWGIPTNGNGKVYSTIMRGISSKSPLRLKLRAYKMHEIKGEPVDEVADLLKLSRATVREWYRSGWLTEADREVLRKIGSKRANKKPRKL